MASCSLCGALDTNAYAAGSHFGGPRPHICLPKASFLSTLSAQMDFYSRVFFIIFIGKNCVAVTNDFAVLIDAKSGDAFRDKVALRY